MRKYKRNDEPSVKHYKSRPQQLIIRSRELGETPLMQHIRKGSYIAVALLEAASDTAVTRHRNNVKLGDKYLYEKMLIKSLYLKDSKQQNVLFAVVCGKKGDLCVTFLKVLLRKFFHVCKVLVNQKSHLNTTVFQELMTRKKTHSLELLSCILEMNPTLSDSYLAENALEAALTHLVELKQNQNQWQSIFFRKSSIGRRQMLAPIFEKMVCCGSNITFVSGGVNLLHGCCLYNLPCALNALLDVLSKTHLITPPTAKQDLLSTNSAHQLTPLLMACGSEFDEFEQESRLECVQVLIKHGADIQALSQHIDATPLISCLAFNVMTEHQVKIASYLVEQGADIFAVDSAGHHALYYAILSHVTSVVKSMLDTGLIDLNEPVLNMKWDLLQFEVTSWLYPVNALEDAPLRFDLIEMLHARGAEVNASLYYILLGHENDIWKELLKKLISLETTRRGGKRMTCLDEGALNHLPLLMTTIVNGYFECFKLLLLYGASAVITFVPRLCLNSPNHRWIKYDILDDYSQQQELKESFLFVCHWCFKDITAEDQISACAVGEKCNTRICEMCYYFTSGTTAEDNDSLNGESCRTLSLENLSSRSSSPVLRNWTKGLCKTSIGALCLESRLISEFEIFLNAGLCDLKLLKRLDEKCLSRLGIVNSDVNQIILTLLKA